MCADCFPAVFLLTPSAADVVTYTVTATNTGSLRLTNLAITIPTVTNLVCSYGADNTTINTALTSSVVLELDAVVQCVGTYTFTQDDIESPPKVVAATATSTTVKGAHTFTSNDVSVTALNAPSLRVDILTADCIKPLRAREYVELQPRELLHVQQSWAYLSCMFGQPSAILMHSKDPCFVCQTD